MEALTPEEIEVERRFDERDARLGSIASFVAGLALGLVLGAAIVWLAS